MNRRRRKRLVQIILAIARRRTVTFLAQRTLNYFHRFSRIPVAASRQRTSLKRPVVDIACTLWAGSQPQGDRHEALPLPRKIFRHGAVYSAPDNRVAATPHRLAIASELELIIIIAYRRISLILYSLGRKKEICLTDGASAILVM